MKMVKRYEKINKIKNKKEKNKSKNYKSNNYIIWGSIVVLTFVAFFMYQYLLLPQIDLKGKTRITIDYKDKYSEAGYSASFLGTDITDSVKVKGKVNTNKIGVYKVVYTVNSGGFSKKVIRRVEVVDDIKPVMDIDNKTLYLCPGEIIKPSKVRAKDNYDGDISNKVETVIKDDKIIYSVEDSSGNVNKIVKNVVFKDVEKPKIKLTYGDLIYTYVGEDFIEPGYVVEDNCNKKLTGKVKVEGKVNTDKIGEYTLKYLVSDKEGNVSSVERKVFVTDKDRKGTIYLTFDDGPKEGVTDKILDILKEEGVKATFFVTNKGPDKLIKRAYDEGHTIALHTATHDYSYVYSSMDSYFEDLKTVSDRVKNITGKESKIIRFPGGSSNTISRRYSPGIMSLLTDEVIKRGYRYYDWNISSGDAEIGTKDKSEVYKNVVDNLSLEKSNMVLMHDIKGFTRDALKDIIKYGKDNGYIFDKITMNTKMVKQRVNN